MARIIFRTDLTGIQELQTNIIAKNTADGAASPLISLLAEQGINLATDAASMESAITSARFAALSRRQVENYVQKRELNFDPVFKNLKNEVQFLKKLKKGKERELGDWGISVDGSNKIVYPSGFEARVRITRSFYAKHLSYPAGTSPLQNFIDDNGINVEREGLRVEAAERAHETAYATSREAEEAQRNSDNLVVNVLAHQRIIGGYLIKLKVKNPKALGEWGFTVDDSDREPKTRKTRIKPTEKITMGGIVIGSSLTNTGTTPIHVYTGKTTTGNPVIVEPLEKIGMIKGFSVITVINPGTLTTAEFTSLQYQ